MMVQKKRVEELLERVSLDPSHFYRYPRIFWWTKAKNWHARAFTVNLNLLFVMNLFQH